MHEGLLSPLLAGGSPLPSIPSCLAGNGSVLVRLLQEGTCKLEEMGSYSEEELRHLLKQCGIPFGAEDSKVSVGPPWRQGRWESSRQGYAYLCLGSCAVLVRGRQSGLGAR